MNEHGDDPDHPLVLVVDDDAAVRLSIKELVESVGLYAACFGSVKDLLDSALYERPGCLVLDVRLPGISGLDFQRSLVSSGNIKPIVFLTGYGDIPMSVEAMKAGAVDFLTKPVRDQSLLDAVRTGIEQDAARRATTSTVQRHIERYGTLTARERQVLRAVANGRLNKQIAFDLGISEVTVKMHRSNGMRKMNAASVGGLIRAWEMLPASVRGNGGHLDYGMASA